MPRRIRNMGTSTMRFNEGIVVSGSIDTSYASKEGVAILEHLYICPLEPIVVW